MLSAVSRAETRPPRIRREELLVADRVGVLQLERAGEPGVGAGLGEQPLGLGEHLVEPPAVPADRLALARLELAGRVDDRHRTQSYPLAGSLDGQPGFQPDFSGRA